MAKYKTIVDIMKFFRSELGARFPGPQAEMLLTLADEGYKAVGELGEAIGVKSGSASRNVAALSEWDTYKNKEGFNLVKLGYDPKNHRGRVVSLNENGLALIKKLESTLNI